MFTVLIFCGVVGFVLCLAGVYRAGKTDGYAAGKANGRALERELVNYELSLKQQLVASQRERQDKEWNELGIAR